MFFALKFTVFLFICVFCTFILHSIEVKKIQFYLFVVTNPKFLNDSMKNNDICHIFFSLGFSFLLLLRNYLDIQRASKTSKYNIIINTIRRRWYDRYYSTKSKLFISNGTNTIRKTEQLTATSQ